MSSLSVSNEELVKRIQSGNDAAGNMVLLWQQVERFIGMLAGKYKGYADIEDLKHEAYFGLVEAVNRYDCEQGVPFINYGSYWIKQVMQRYIQNCESTVRIPVNAHESISKYKQEVARYLQEHGVEPSDEAIASLLGVSLTKLGAIKKSLRMSHIDSLDMPYIGLEGVLPVMETVPSAENLEDDVVKAVDKQSMKEELWAAVDNLPGELPEVIRGRYQDNRTLKEMGEAKGVSIERIRQQERTALQKLKLPKASRKYKPYYEQYMQGSRFRHTTLAEFRYTWTSQTERAALQETNCCYARKMGFYDLCDCG